MSVFDEIAIGLWPIRHHQHITLPPPGAVLVGDDLGDDGAQLRRVDHRQTPDGEFAEPIIAIDIGQPIIGRVQALRGRCQESRDQRLGHAQIVAVVDGAGASQYHITGRERPV